MVLVMVRDEYVADGVFCAGRALKPVVDHAVDSSTGSVVLQHVRLHVGGAPIHASRQQSKRNIICSCGVRDACM
jgi:hypothetical protein